MSYEKYKDYRLVPDDNGCWDVLSKDYEQLSTYPSKSAAKRAIDEMVSQTIVTNPTTPEDKIDAFIDKWCVSLEARHALLGLLNEARIKQLDDLWEVVPIDAEHIETVKDISELFKLKLRAATPKEEQ